MQSLLKGLALVSWMWELTAAHARADRLTDAGGDNLDRASGPAGGHNLFLVDVSRLIWRHWSGRLPTGIDRVCLAYIEYFGARADAVIQWKDRDIALTAADAQRLMTLFTGEWLSRQRLSSCWAGHFRAPSPLAGNSAACVKLR